MAKFPSLPGRPRAKAQRRAANLGASPPHQASAQVFKAQICGQNAAAQRRTTLPGESPPHQASAQVFKAKICGQKAAAQQRTSAICRRFCVRNRRKTAGILYGFQGFGTHFWHKSFAKCRSLSAVLRPNKVTPHSYITNGGLTPRSDYPIPFTSFLTDCRSHAWDAGRVENKKLF